MERIVILGRGGAGKTVLARQIGQRIGAPVICLDAIWQAEWTDEDVPHFRTLLEEAHAGERWISDGNFALATFDIRLPRATLVIWLEHSKLSSSWRAFRRVFQPGEPHRFGGLLKVIKFIWKFDRVNRPRIEASRASHGPDVPVLRLKSRRDIASFLASLRSESGS